jgi:hypothetical protein
MGRDWARTRLQRWQNLQRAPSLFLDRSLDASRHGGYVEILEESGRQRKRLASVN